MEIRKTLVLSTAHITYETNRMLRETDAEEWPCVGGPYSAYGWFVYAHEENLGEGKDRIPDELFAVMQFARAKGCDNVLLDEDAETVDELPTWEL